MSFSYYFHDLASNGLRISTIEKTSFHRIELPSTWQEWLTLESSLFEDIVYFCEVAIGTADIPKRKTHHDRSCIAYLLESAKESRIEFCELATFGLHAVK